MSLKSLLLNLLFPKECLGCRREGDWLCANCFRDLKFSGPDKAAYLNAPNLDKIFIAGDYDDALLANAIKKFKYNFIAALGQTLGRFLVIFWQGQIALAENSRLLSDLTLIPIPLTKKRLRWRGFNQAEILARELQAAFAYPLNQELLRKTQGETQAGLSENERTENIRNSFVWTGGDLSGRIIVLVDDVVTTGATLNEAARVLKAAGAEKIYGLVLAKG